MHELGVSFSRLRHDRRSVTRPVAGRHRRGGMKGEGKKNRFGGGGRVGKASRTESLILRTACTSSRPKEEERRLAERKKEKIKKVDSTCASRTLALELSSVGNEGEEKKGAREGEKGGPRPSPFRSIAAMYPGMEKKKGGKNRGELSTSSPT